MEKRKLSAIPRPIATPEMIEIADRLGDMRHIVTAELIDDKKILLLNFFEIQALKKGKTEAAFRTFLSHEDYITQDLKTSKTKWLTASFHGMYNFSFTDYVWNQQEHKSSYGPIRFRKSYRFWFMAGACMRLYINGVWEKHGTLGRKASTLMV